MSTMETNSNISTQLDKLTCPVCCDRFKTPKMLPCGHTFCQPCVHQLFQSTPIYCPVCRIQVSTPHTSVDQLPTNYALKALVDSNASLFDKESICRSFGECPTHKNVCDQFCRTCEKQVCKQCISDHHQGPSHDTSPVGAVVVQHKEVLDNLIIELGGLMKRLEVIASKITESEKTCHSEADKLDEDIKVSVAECMDNIAVHGESLQVVIQQDKKKIMEYLSDLKLKHSQVFLSSSYVLDQCQSLQTDLDKNNLSRISVMKKLTENEKKIRKDLEKLEGKENVLYIGLKFQPSTTEAKAGKLARKTSLIPKAIPLETISFENEEWSKADRNLFTYNQGDMESHAKPEKSCLKTKSSAIVTPVSSLLGSSTHGFQLGSSVKFAQPHVSSSLFGSGRQGLQLGSSTTVAEPKIESDTEDKINTPLLTFLWPSPTWMIAVRVKTAGVHSYVKFANLHFLRKTFYHEIGVDQKWSFVSHNDFEGKFVLCFSPGKVHKFSLPLIQNLKEPGKIVSTVFTPQAILGIAWDELHLGCYALLNDGKTLLRVEFGGPEGFKEVVVFEEEIKSNGDTHFFHVNEEGSMGICDQNKKVVYFFEKIQAEPTVTVKEPPDLQNATLECVNSRGGEKLWYVIWKFQSTEGYEIKLYVYDSLFHLIDCVPNLKITIKSVDTRVNFCFQSDYVAVTVGNEVEIYALC